MEYLIRSTSGASAFDPKARHSRIPALGVVVVLLVASLLFGATTGLAKSWSYDLAGELMSPYCPGRTLASCPSPQAAELVQWMVVQEAGGATREQIVEMLIERFGEEILGAPPAKGITLWAYLLPMFGFVAGGGLVIVVLRRLVAKSPVVEPGSNPERASTSAALDEDLAMRVDADLAARG